MHNTIHCDNVLYNSVYFIYLDATTIYHVHVYTSDTEQNVTDNVNITIFGDQGDTGQLPKSNSQQDT